MFKIFQLLQRICPRPMRSLLVMLSTSKVETLAYMLSWILNFILRIILTLCPNFILKFIYWCPSSEKDLEYAEEMIFLNLKEPYTIEYVNIGKCCGKTDSFMRTISLNKNSNKTPIVLLHGFACSIGFWVMNLDSISANRPVYAVDVLGFGRSSRPPFSNDAAEAEMQFFISVEKWRIAVGLEKFILLGHSMGGYIASSYALHYPERVSLLILEDPWGISEKPISFLHHYELDIWVKFLDHFIKGFNFLAAMRATGRWAPRLVRLVRQDFKKKYSKFLIDPDSILDYLYHCNVQTPSGEAAFKAMTDGSGWAENPMIHRISNLDRNVPITFVYGSRSWINRTPGMQIKYTRLNSYVDVRVVDGAGHHVHADKPEEFNNMINRICDDFDRELMLNRNI